MCGHESQNGRQLSWAKMAGMVPVERKHLLAALCSTAYRVARKLHRLLSMGNICNSAKEWFCEAIQKLPRRWQCCVDLEEEYVKPAVV